MAREREWSLWAELTRFRGELNAAAQSAAQRAVLGLRARGEARRRPLDTAGAHVVFEPLRTRPTIYTVYAFYYR